MLILLMTYLQVLILKYQCVLKCVMFYFLFLFVLVVGLDLLSVTCSMTLYFLQNFLFCILHNKKFCLHTL